MFSKGLGCLRLLGLAATAALVVACGGGGGGGGGSGTVTPSTIGISGTAAKGILRGAEVKVYEVIGGVQSAIALATATTNANGEYTLNIVPTSNPVIIEVKAIAGTTMLDETQIDGSGNFTVVPAELVAPGLTLRSFNSSASEAALVRINPLTETAVAIAAQTKDANGKAIGLTADALRSAKQIVLEQLAPEGVNPFITVPPTTWANASEEQKRLVIFAAGLMKQGDVKVAIANLSKGVAPTLASDGIATLSGADRAKLNTQRKNIVDKAAQDTSLPTSLRTAAQTEAAKPANSTISTEAVTVDSKVVAATEGFTGFIESLRTAFRTTEKALEDVGKDLDITYGKASITALDYLSPEMNRALDDCTFSAGSFICNSPWTANGSNNFKRAYTTADGMRLVSTTVSGTPGANGGTIVLNSTVLENDSGKKKLGEIENATLTVSKPYADLPTAINASLTSGSVKVYELSPMLLTLRPIGSGLELAQPSRIVTTLKGGLELVVTDSSGATRDKLSGTLDLSQLSQDGFVTKMDLSLSALNKNAFVASLALNLARTKPSNVYARTTENNFGATEMKFDIGLPNSSRFVFEMKNPSFADLTQTLTIKTSGSEVVLSGQYVQQLSPNYASAWCEEMNSVYRCANSLSLRATDGLYVAEVKRVTGKATGDIKNSAGVTVGKIKNNVIQINGSEVSLY